MFVSSIIGGVLLFMAGAVPWGSLLDWAREEIKSKPRNGVV